MNRIAVRYNRVQIYESHLPLKQISFDSDEKEKKREDETTVIIIIMTMIGYDLTDK